MEEPHTYREMCQMIADQINRVPRKSAILGVPPGQPITAEAIWKISPSGELWEIYCLYEEWVQNKAADKILVALGSIQTIAAAHKVDLPELKEFKITPAAH